MSQQIIIIGLGHFGMSLARRLTEKGAEVLAVDINKLLVQEASTFVAEAVVLNAADETMLAKLDPGNRDSAVCAIGDDSRESSIICVALLRQMGAPLIIARANDIIHRRILKLVGAHLVVNPEAEFGKRFANRLLFKDIVADSYLEDDLRLTEIVVLKKMIGKNLIELELPKKFGLTVAGVRKPGKPGISTPNPSEPLCEGDNLVIVSSEQAITNFLKKENFK